MNFGELRRVIGLDSASAPPRDPWELPTCPYYPYVGTLPDHRGCAGGHTGHVSQRPGLRVMIVTDISHRDSLNGWNVSSSAGRLLRRTP